MSNSRRVRRNLRNYTVMLGRFKAEFDVGGPGLYMGTVYHDDDCPGLANESMLQCECRPQIDIDKWQGGSS